MSELISQRMKLLDKKIKETNLMSTDLRAALNNIQYRLALIPWWKYAIVFVLYWLIKLYLQTGWASLATFAVTLAVSSNLLVVLPRISDNVQDRFIPIASDSKNIISQSAVILNKEAKDNRIVVKKLSGIEEAYKTLNIELITGDIYKGKLIAETAQIYTLLILVNDKQISKKIEKELVQRAW